MTFLKKFFILFSQDICAANLPSQEQTRERFRFGKCFVFYFSNRWVVLEQTCFQSSRTKSFVTSIVLSTRVYVRYGNVKKPTGVQIKSSITFYEMMTGPIYNCICIWLCHQLPECS